MELKKYKVCPSCQFHNPPNKMECKKCETDLTGVRVVDEAIEELEKKKEIEQPPVAGEQQTSMARVCECGEKNPPQARKCKACGEDISDILPTPAATAKTKGYRLASIDGQISVSISESVFVVGREAELSTYLASKMYVSRQHCRFTVSAEKVYISNLSKTNKTFINNEEIHNDEPFLLNDGDEIALGGKVINGNRQDQAAYFRIKLNDECC